MNKKTRISPVLKALEIGDDQTYPAERAVSIRSTIDRIQSSSEKKFSTKTFYNETNQKLVRVTRIA
jgi:hypothetical protein